jgi:hypothetical protein
MSQIEVERLLGRLLTDHKFRTSAAHSLEKAASKEGIVLSKTEALILKSIDISRFIQVSNSLDDSIKRS